jgi:hypothetical protein
MSIESPWVKLTPPNVEALPAVPGVYEVATLVRNTLFFGRTDGRDLRSCLADFLAHQERHRTLYFRYEETLREEQRHRDLMAEYKRTHDGCLPPLNGDRTRPGAVKPARVGSRAPLEAVS